MTPKCDECPWDGCTKSISSWEEESKLSRTNFVVFPQTCSDISATKCTSSAPKWDGYVYKRRKLHRNSLVLVSEENATASPKGSFGHHLQKAVTVLSSQIESVPNSAPSRICPVGEDEVHAEVSIGDLHKYASECYSSVNDRYSLKPNVGHGSTSMKTAAEVAGECSSFDVFVVEPLGKFTSVKDLCIYVLKSHGLLGGVWTSTGCASLEVLCDNDTKFSQSCKICGLLENPVKMLICDCCEEAFHLSCFKPKVKKLPVNEWYCQPCFKKKPKTLQKNSTGKSVDIIKRRKRISPGDLNPIILMLKDVQPYISHVRIGKDFQAEVPDWSGPIYD